MRRLCRSKHILYSAQFYLKFVERDYLFIINSKNLITLCQTEFAGRRILHHTINLQRHIQIYEARTALNHTEHVEIARQIKRHRFALTDDIDLLSLREITIQIAIKGLELTQIGAYQDILILEAQCLCLGIELHTITHIAGSHIIVAPMEQNHGIDEESQHEVNQHATYHDEQALPCRFAAKLVWLFRLFHLFGIKTFIYHTRNLAISSEWQPSQTIGSIRILWFELEEMEPRVEEQIELLHSYTKEFGEEEVSALMEQH